MVLDVCLNLTNQFGRFFWIVNFYLVLVDINYMGDGMLVSLDAVLGSEYVVRWKLVFDDTFTTIFFANFFENVFLDG